MAFYLRFHQNSWTLPDLTVRGTEVETAPPGNDGHLGVIVIQMSLSCLSLLVYLLLGCFDLLAQQFEKKISLEILPYLMIDDF